MNETSVIFEQISKFKHILKEYVSRGDIADAINNREVVKIYYHGDNTERPGYRTIEPYVLGFIKHKDADGNMIGDGELALRAWEQAGASDSYNDIGIWAKHPPRLDHEFFNSYPNGRKQPGWRLFKLKGITSLFFTGYKFPPNNQSLRPLYNPNDKQLEVIISVKPPSEIGSQEVMGADSVDANDTIKQKLSAFDTQAKNFTIDANNKEEVLKQNVQGLWDMVKKYAKKSPKNYEVINKDNKYFAVPKYNVSQYDPTQVVGNLYDLFNKYNETEWKDNNFHQSMINKAKQADNIAKNNQNI